MINGFIKVAALSSSVELGNVKTNVFHLTNSYSSRFDTWSADVVVYPELSLTGCSLGDLFTNTNLVNLSVEQGILDFMQSMKDEMPIFVIGAPIEYNNLLYNCAIVIKNNSILGVVPKNYCNEESRWFADGRVIKGKEMTLCNMKVPFGTDLIFNVKNGARSFKFGIEIGDDIESPCPPSTLLSLAGAEVILNLGSSNELVGKNDYMKSLISNQSSRCINAYVYSSSGWGESSTDTVYVPKGFIYENGVLLSEVTNRFHKTDDYKLAINDIDLNRLRLLRKKSSNFKSQSIVGGYRYIEIDLYDNKPLTLTRSYPKMTFDSDPKSLEDIFNIQVTGLIRRLNITNGKVVLGVSGGSDSTLALLVAIEAMKRSDRKLTAIHGLTMPCYGTTDRTKMNSLKLMELLGITSKKVMISNAVTQHRKDIGLPKEDRSVVYENCQARERTQVLMDYANIVGAIVLGTGDLSELALGWCTYNADHMSMYNVNVGVPKTLVRAIIKWYVDTHVVDVDLKYTLNDILETPISPELLPDQETEDTIGSYELHDFFLYHIMRSGWDKNTLISIASSTFSDVMTEDEVKKWFNVFHKRFMTQQFKRSCLPDGPKVGSVGLSPRGDWCMPSDMNYNKVK